MLRMSVTAALAAVCVAFAVPVMAQSASPAAGANPTGMNGAGTPGAGLGGAGTGGTGPAEPGTAPTMKKENDAAANKGTSDRSTATGAAIGMSVGTTK